MKKMVLFLLIFPFVLTAQNFWTEVSPFDMASLTYPTQISIVDDQVVWVNGVNYLAPINQWSRSLDAGVTWTSGEIDLGSFSRKVSSIHAVSNSKAYVSVYSNAVGVYGGVWMTNDSGATWMQQPSALFNSLDSFADFIYFFDSNHGIVVGDPENNYFEIYTTEDAGNTWVRVPQIAIPDPLNEEYAYSMNYEARGNSIWFGTNKGRVYKSSNMGISWTVSQSPAADLEQLQLAFKNENEGLLGGYYKTTDGGNGWFTNPLDLSTSHYLKIGLAYVPQTNNTYFSWGEDLEIAERGSSYSIDGGISWIDLNAVDAMPVLPQTAKFQSGTVGFCIGTYYFAGDGQLRFFRLTDPLNRLAKTDFTAIQKFHAIPNPTKGSVKISGAAINSLTVGDTSGKIILSEKYNVLNETSFDVSSFQNGIYFIKVTTDGGKTETLKIIKN